MSRTTTFRYSSTVFLLLLTVSVFSGTTFADETRAEATIANITKISGIPEPLSSYTPTPATPTPSSAKFGGSAFGYSSFNTSNVSSSIYTENSLICSNEPSGKYCEDWEASCKQTTGTYMDDRFWIYYRIKDSVHSNKVDVTHYSDAKDPNGNDICWNSGCEDRVRADIKFDCPNCPWICTWWTFTLRGTPGKWNVFFDIKDNIDKSSAKLDTYPEMWCKSNSDCSGSSLCQNKQCVKCGAKSESAWVDQNSNTCDNNLVTKHKFSNTG
ncbi:MAG: hypothetical protein HY517_02190, partial [Candidatus Aenigmarchaeota archaeon]|nr:hypothetical protein [Candidatus Aenigmarchaeota archaeon]